jgi:glycerol-3-phosphate dehydrogenase (NAD(P)+)
MKPSTDPTYTQPIAILGGGAWGTALAVHLARNNQLVYLWEFERKQVAAMQKARCNQKHLPGVDFPETLQVFNDLAQAVDNVADILLVVPSFVFQQTLVSLKPFINTKSRIAWATKGIDPESNELFSQLITKIYGKIPMAVLSGPSFAKEVAAGLPTAITAAANNQNFAQDIVKHFNHQTFRVYTNDDLIGVQLGGAIKNVIAIACGASDGLKFGANAKSALITRGLAEMMRLGKAMGAKQNTFMGLSGLGDLVLTCTDDQSRNRRLGLEIAKGRGIDETEKLIGQVVEGVHTAKQIIYLAKQFKIEMPICEQVWRVLTEKFPLKYAVKKLIEREPKAELY